MANNSNNDEQNLEDQVPLKVSATIRNPSDKEKESWIALSKMAHPDLHTPLGDLYKLVPTEQLEQIRIKVINAVATYLRMAQADANNWMNDFLNDVKLEPDKRQEIFVKHRNHYVAQLYERQKYQYLYYDFYEKVTTNSPGILEKIANEIWHIASKENEELMNILWMFQRLYGCFFVVEKVNEWQNQQMSLATNINQTQLKYNMNELDQKTFYNIKTRFNGGVMMTSQHFEIFDEFSKNWPEQMAVSKEKTTQKVATFLSLINNGYKEISYAESPKIALQVLKSLKTYIASEASKPRVTGGLVTMPDGTKTLRNVARDTRFDKLAEQAILPLINTSIDDLDYLIQSQNPVIKNDSRQSTPPPDGQLKLKIRTEGTQQIARRAITLFEDQIKNIVQREKGKRSPLTEKQIVAEAINKYVELAPVQRFAATDKGITRYLFDIGKQITARKYAGQIVRQERGRN